MNIEKIHARFLSSKLLLFITVFAFIAIRLYPTYNHPELFFLAGSTLIQIGIAFFLLQINHIFNITQKRTFLPALFYLLFIGINPVFYFELKGSIAALCVVLSYYFLFNSYQEPKSQINALNISLLLVLGSLLWTPLLFFFPIFWIGFYHFQCFNTKVFFANLTGFVIVYLFIFAWSLFKEDIKLFLSMLPQLESLIIVTKPELTDLEWITCGLLIASCILIGANLFLSNISERVWTISVLRFFYFSAFVFFIFYFIQSEYKSTWGLITFIPVAFLSGHFFSRANNKIVHYLLILFFLFLVGIGIAQYISA